MTVCDATNEGFSPRNYLISFICFLIAGLVTGGVLTLVAYLGIESVDLSQAEELYALPLNMYKPEPLERRLFVIGIVTYPTILAMLWPLVTKAVLRIRNPETIVVMQWITGLIVTVGSIGIVAYGFVADKIYFKDINCYMVFGSGILSIICVWFARMNDVTILNLNRIKLLTDIAASVLIAFVATFSIYGINAVSESPVYSYHFNSVFHAMVQVFNGKELLADLTSIYGLFPHFLEPIFKVTGLSVLSFTIIMGLLTAISYLLIYFFLKLQLRNAPLALLGLSAILYFTFVIFRLDSGDPYFQYHPLRLLFPSVTIFMVFKYLNSPSRKSYLTTFVLTSLAMLWNFDSGFVCFFAWLLVLLFTESSRPKVRTIACHLLCGTACLAGTVAIFTAYLKVRYGVYPDYSIMLSYQKLFYVFGYMMLPMPLFHAWNLIIMIYMAGIIFAFARRDSTDTSLGAMVFFLSVLGVGLFTYYQGRSHDYNLAGVSYPAFILLAIFSQQLLNKIRKDAGGIVISVTAGAVLGVFFVSSFAFVKVAGTFFSATQGRLSATYNEAVTPIVEDSEFVKRVTKPGEEVLILSNLSSIYYLGSRTSCPVNIAGPTELFLVDEYRKIQSFMMSPKSGHIIVDNNFVSDKALRWDNPYKQELWSILASRYRRIAVSPTRNLALFVAID